MARSFQSIALLVTLLVAMQCSVGVALASALDPTQKQATGERAWLLSVERDPTDIQSLQSLGEYYLHNERWQKSEYWLAKAYALSGGSEAIGYDLAYACMQAGDLDDAKGYIEQTLGRADSARLHNLLGEVEERHANYLDAAKEYHRAAEIDPSESNIFDLATFLLQHKQYVGFVDESIKFFRYGVSKYPQSSKMMVGLGVALYASAQYDEALRVLCAAVDLDPKDRRPIEFLGKARRVSSELAKEVDRRLEDFAQRYPKNAATNYYYAVSLWERGGGEEGKNIDKIEALLRKAETEDPRWYEPHFQRGILLQSEKQYPEAIREMVRTVKIKPDFGPAHYRLATLYGQTGEKSLAARELAIIQSIKNKHVDDTGVDAGK